MSYARRRQSSGNNFGVFAVVRDLSEKAGQKRTPNLIPPVLQHGPEAAIGAPVGSLASEHPGSERVEARGLAARNDPGFVLAQIPNNTARCQRAAPWKLTAPLHLVDCRIRQWNDFRETCNGLARSCF